MLGIGLQCKSVDTLSAELDLPPSQLLGLFNRLIRRSVQYFNAIMEQDIEKSLIPMKDVTLTPVAQSMQQELEEAAKVRIFYGYFFKILNKMFNKWEE